ncbi:nuclear pore complex protein Nup50 [Synchiropus picturatus]
MAKRIADKELTDRNWDQEEEEEEAGTFSVASEDVLKNRPIKKAKRRNAASENETSGAFKGFSGFGGFKGLGGLTNGNGVASPFGGFSSLPITPSAKPDVTGNGSASTGDTSANGSAPQSSGGNSQELKRQITGLNCSVRDWITKHVNSNPLCDLSPIFKDYQKHLDDIQKKFGLGSGDASSEQKQGGSLPAAAAPPPTSSGSPAAPLFSFKNTSEDSKGSAAAPTPAGVTFNFGQKVDSSVLGSVPSKMTPASFSFSTGQSSLFGGTSLTAPASFGSPKTEVAQPTEENPDEESEEPPKPEVKEVKEEDAFYSKKCKLFYKKETEFKEKGVGNLHLKATTEGKTQLIIRADTNLGNILLNIIVQASMPCSRVGKNNVMVVCVPNPPVDEKNADSPVPMLIRVKTSEDADELLKTLEEKKG